jgi:hypothetical protein
VRKISNFQVHRPFGRVKVDIGRCDVCGEKKTGYWSRGTQAKVCEVRRFGVRLPGRQEYEHQRCENRSMSTDRSRGCYARLVREWNMGEEVR